MAGISTTRRRSASALFNPFRKWPQGGKPRRLGSHFRPLLEALEDRLAPATTITITGSVTLDESPGLQTSGVAVPGEDNNDNDVALSQLPPSFSNRLFGSPAAGLGLSSTFAT